MRKMTPILLLLALIFAAPLNTVKAQTNRTISVTGSAEVRVMPDEVLITLGIENWSPILKTAKEANDAAMKSLLGVTESMGIEAKYVQMDYVNIEPRYDVRDNESRRIAGYFVRRNVVIVLKDLTKFEPLLTASLESGVNYVQGIQFRTTELRKYRDQARALAIKADKEKAMALAGEVGDSVGEAISISEGQIYWYANSSGRSNVSQNVVQEGGGEGGELEGALAPGQIVVSAVVTVTFELID